MYPMLEETTVVPRLRTPARGGTERSVNNNVRKNHAKDLDIVWDMDSDLRRLALSFGNSQIYNNDVSGTI